MGAGTGQVVPSRAGKKPEWNSTHWLGSPGTRGGHHSPAPLCQSQGSPHGAGRAWGKSRGLSEAPLQALISSGPSHSPARSVGLPCSGSRMCVRISAAPAAQWVPAALTAPQARGSKDRRWCLTGLGPGSMQSGCQQGWGSGGTPSRPSEAAVLPSPQVVCGQLWRLVS